MARRVLARVSAGGQLETFDQATEAEKASFAEALRTRTPPQISGTDSARFRGRYNGNPFRGMVPMMQQDFQRQADALGISTSGKFYNGALVRPEFQGRFDPQALVGSTSDAREVAESHPEWDVDGIVKQKGREQEVPDDGPYRVREGLVEEAVVAELQANGVEQISVKEFDELKDKTRARFEGSMNDD